jgi:molecular chaperone DnaK (HSP70)
MTALVGICRNFRDENLSRRQQKARRIMTSTPTENSTVLGIAFGNSTTQIAFISRAGQPECLANEDGERQIPSTLSYSEGEEYHGGQAKSQLVRNPANTVTLFRDWLGQKYAINNLADSQVQYD